MSRARFNDLKWTNVFVIHLSSISPFHSPDVPMKFPAQWSLMHLCVHIRLTGLSSEMISFFFVSRNFIPLWALLPAKKIEKMYKWVAIVNWELKSHSKCNVLKSTLIYMKFPDVNISNSISTLDPLTNIYIFLRVTHSHKNAVSNQKWMWYFGHKYSEREEKSHRNNFWMTADVLGIGASERERKWMDIELK
jgi:hypothetical protein